MPTTKQKLATYRAKIERKENITLSERQDMIAALNEEIKKRGSVHLKGMRGKNLLVELLRNLER